MNPIAIVFNVFLLICNGQEYRVETKGANPGAIIMNDSALSILLTRETDDAIEKAISLFDSCLIIQPDYYPARCNKLSTDLIKGKRMNSLSTLKTLEVERPDNPDIKLMLGILLLTTDDSLGSQGKFLEADTLYANALQSITNDKSDTFKTTLRNYAINLKMLGNDRAANAILVSLPNFKKHEAFNDLMATLLAQTNGSHLRKELSRAR